MRPDAAVGCQLAGGNRFNGVEGFVAEHGNQVQGFRVQGVEPEPSFQVGFQHTSELLLRAIELRLHRAQRQLQRVGEILVLHAL